MGRNHVIWPRGCQTDFTLSEIFQIRLKIIKRTFLDSTQVWLCRKLLLEWQTSILFQGWPVQMPHQCNTTLELVGGGGTICFNSDVCTYCTVRNAGATFNLLSSSS